MWSNVKELFKDIFICVACCTDMGIVVFVGASEWERGFSWQHDSWSPICKMNNIRADCSCCSIGDAGRMLLCKGGRVKDGQIDRQSGMKTERETGRDTDGARGGVLASRRHRLQFWFRLKFSFSGMVFVKSCQIVLSIFSELSGQVVFNLLYPTYQQREDKYTPPPPRRLSRTTGCTR